MNNIFLIVFLLSLLSLVVGLIKPSILRLSTRKLISKIFIPMILISFFLFGITLPETSHDQNVELSQELNQIKNQEIQEATSDVGNEEPAYSEGINTSQYLTQQNTLTQSNTEASKPTTSSYFSVTQVVDGDTIKINMNGKEETIRLIGLDTPETVDPRKSVQCFSKESSNKAIELLSGKKVRIETDSTQGEKDKYGRLLAYVYLEDGLFYNKYMIEQGYAHEYTYNTPYKYQSEFKAAQINAQSFHLGLWSPDTCNGDTTSSTTITQVASSSTITSPSGLYYTSSHHSSKYYYPESCTEWKKLSPSYLKSYSSVDALLIVYPTKTKSPSCN